MTENDRRFWLDRALENLKKIKARPGCNEKETQRLLIEPLLAWAGYEVWGWKPDELRENYPVEGIKADKYPDYALMSGNKPYIILEAKAFNEPLDKEQLHQISSYCKSAEVRFGLITNGERWILLDNDWKEKENALERYVIDLKIEDDLGKDRKGYEVLLLFHPSKKEALEWAIDKIKTHETEEDESLRNDFIKTALANTLEKFKIPKGEEKPPVPQEPTKKEGVAAGEWPENLKILRHKSPPDYVLIDGKKLLIDGSWASVLVAVAEWLVNQGKITEPVKGKKLFIINNRPEQPKTKMTNPESYLKRLSNGFYVWTHGSAEVLLERSLKLLEDRGYKPGRDFLKPPADWKP